MKKKIVSFAIIIILYLSVAVSVAEDTAKNIYYSDDILELIHSGADVSYEDAVIIGDLKLNKSQKVVNSSITIKNSEIIGDIDFGNVFFKKPISFQKTIFSGSNFNFNKLNFSSDISFSRARFNCIAKFKDINTKGSMTFDKTVWSDTVFFENCTCKGYASFRNSEFKEEFHLKNANITGQIDFEDSQFNKDAIFRNSTFRNQSNFLGVHFYRRCDLRGSKFYKPAIFTRSDFDEIADFSSSDFIGAGEFYQASFNGFANFSSARFLDSAFFNESQFNKAARFTNSTFLKNVSFSSALFDRDAYFDASRFESKIDITNAAFSELALPWDAIEGRVIYDRATQLSLINNYKKLGWTSDYKNSYYNYRKEKMISDPFGFEKFLDFLSFWLWGYGTKMYYSMIWIIFLAFFFALIYYGLTRIKWAEAVEISIQPGLEMCPYAKKEHDLGGKLPFKKALLFSIKTLLLMENQDDLKIRHAHTGKIIWIEKVVCGYLAVNFMNYLLELLQSYFKLP